MSELGKELSPGEQAELRRLMAFMIPASDEFGVPGADDPAIFADTVRSLGRDTADVRAALASLAALAGGSFTALDDARAEAIAHEFLARSGREMIALGRAVLQCYYRDDRVLRSVGIEPTPPFPRGNKLEQGDWSLLDPVRTRAQIWRDDRRV
jgi:hypothetical protein